MGAERSGVGQPVYPSEPVRHHAGISLERSAAAAESIGARVAPVTAGAAIHAHDIGAKGRHSFQRLGEPDAYVPSDEGHALVAEEWGTDGREPCRYTSGMVYAESCPRQHTLVQ